MGDPKTPSAPSATPKPGAPVLPPIGARPEGAVTRPEGGRTAHWVIWGILGGSVAVSLLAYYQFGRSEEAILNDLQAVHQKGATLAVEACVDEVLDWHANRCGGMVALCDRSVGRMMEQCLDGRDRSDYCSHVDATDSATTSFGYADCEARAKSNSNAKNTKKQCGTAYRAIAYYCLETNKRTGKAPKSTPEVAP